MKNEIKKADPIALIKQGKKIPEKEAEKEIERIASKEDKYRFEKGLYWTCLKNGTRKRICKKHGWSYSTIEQYARFAREISFISTNEISYTDWLKALQSGIKKDERIKLIESSKTEEGFRKKVEKAIEKKKKKSNQFGNGPVISINDNEEDPEPETETEPEPEPIPDPEPEPITPDSMDYFEAMEIFGIEPLTLETVKVLHKYYANKYHPDKGGNPDKMALVNEAVKLLKEDLKNE